jgi:hypothetical protein
VEASGAYDAAPLSGTPSTRFHFQHKRAGATKTDAQTYVLTGLLSSTRDVCNTGLFRDPAYELMKWLTSLAAEIWHVHHLRQDKSSTSAGLRTRTS